MEMPFAQTLLVPPLPRSLDFLFKWLPSSPISTVMLKSNTHLTLSRGTMITIILESRAEKMACSFEIQGGRPLQQPFC